jgi:hypothetical protein
VRSANDVRARVEPPVPRQPARAHAEHVAHLEGDALSGGGLGKQVGGDGEGRIARDVDAAGDVEQHSPPGDPHLGPRLDPRRVPLHHLRGPTHEEAVAGVGVVTEAVPLRRALGVEVVEPVVEHVAHDLEHLVAHGLATEHRRVRLVEGQVEAEASTGAHEARRRRDALRREQRE